MTPLRHRPLRRNGHSRSPRATRQECRRRQTQTLVESAPTTTQRGSKPEANWSGYVVPSSSALVTDVSGDWTVPMLNCADTPNGDESTWVGIGGQEWATGGTSGALLQTGINSDCVDGAQQNTAWWEEVPATPNDETDFHGLSRGRRATRLQASVFETTTARGRPKSHGRKHRPYLPP